MHGVICFNKPAGISSADVVAQVKRLLPHPTKIGHAGTLDPFATGVLLLLVGNATKLCEYLMGQPKEYQATIKLGAITPTDDPEAAEVPTLQAQPPPRSRVEHELGKFLGEILQRPPAYSAVKIAGQPAYKLARKGQQLNLKERTVRVDHIEILDYTWPLLRVRVLCGRGVYIRALARDLGEALGCGGYVRELLRNRVGQFALDNAVTLQQLREHGAHNYLRQVRD